MATGIGDHSTSVTGEPGIPPGAGTTSRSPDRWGRLRTRPALWAVVLIVAIAVGGTIGADWATGGRLLDGGHGTAPAAPCNGSPLHLYGAVSEGLDSNVNRSFATLSATFSNDTGGCTITTLNASAGSTGLGPLANGSAEFLLLGSFPTPAGSAGLPLPIIYIPGAIGAVAIIYHPGGLPVPLDLTSASLAGIFAGTIRNWTDPAIESANPGIGPTAPGAVAPAYLSGSTGATASLTAFLSATNATWNASIGAESVPTGFRGTPVDGASAMVDFVASTSGAVGYLPADELTSSLVGTARVEDRAGDFVSPNATGLSDAATSAASVALQAIKSGAATVTPGPNLSAWTVPGNGSYPLTTFDYVVLYHDVGLAYGGRLTVSDALGFLTYLEWVIGAGQATFDATGSVPLPAGLAAISLNVLAQVSYRGEPALSGGLGEGEGPGEGGNETGGEA
jgi:phosphate transport system substrate-binding protein